MICPICNEGKLAFCQDSIVAYAMFESNGVPDISNIVLETSGLDSTWIECSRCHATSEENSVLENIYNNIGRYPQETRV